MEIQWHNIFATVLLITACVTATKNGDSISAFLSTIGQIGRGTPDEQVKGLVAFAVVAVCVIAALRLLLQSRNGK